MRCQFTLETFLKQVAWLCRLFHQEQKFSARNTLRSLNYEGFLYTGKTHLLLIQITTCCRKKKRCLLVVMKLSLLPQLVDNMDCSLFSRNVALLNFFWWLWILDKWSEYWHKLFVAYVLWICCLIIFELISMLKPKKRLTISAELLG